MKRSQFFIIIVLLLFSMVSVVSGQSNPKSDGCNRASGGFVVVSIVGGTVSPAFSGSQTFTLAAENYFAGEEVAFGWRWSVDTTLQITSPIADDSVVNTAGNFKIYSIIIPTDGVYDFTFTVIPTMDYSSFGYVISCNATPDSINDAQPSSEDELVVVIGGCDFEDGRVNARDCDASIVIYQTDMIVDLYAIDPSTSEGLSILQIAIADINPVEQNTLLGETTHPDTGEVVQLWLLASGELQLQTVSSDDKPYIIIWSVDDPQDYIRRIE